MSQNNRNITYLIGEEGQGKCAILDSGKQNCPQLKNPDKKFSSTNFLQNFRYWVNYKKSHMDLKKRKFASGKKIFFLQGLIFI